MNFQNCTRWLIAELNNLLNKLERYKDDKIKSKKLALKKLLNNKNE